MDTRALLTSILFLWTGRRRSLRSSVRTVVGEVFYRTAVDNLANKKQKHFCERFLEKFKIITRNPAHKDA